MRKILAALGALLAMATVRADMTQVELDHPEFSGTIFCTFLPNPVDVTSGEGGTGLNMLPTAYTLNRKSNIEFPGKFQTDISILQIKRYIIYTNKFMPITPRTVVASLPAVSKLAGSDSGTDASEPNLDGKLFSATAWASSDDYKYGKFQLVIRISYNGSTWATIHEQNFIISPVGLRDSNTDGGSNPYGGGGLTPGDLNGQNINQGGFWEGILSGLFVPQEETLNTLRDTLMQWGTWGPFGIITALNTRFQEYQTDGGLEYSFTINLPFAGATTFDLTPYETFIKIARVLMSMAVWFLVVWGLWHKVYKKV